MRVGRAYLSADRRNLGEYIPGAGPWRRRWHALRHLRGRWRFPNDAAPDLPRYLSTGRSRHGSQPDSYLLGLWRDRPLATRQCRLQDGVVLLTGGLSVLHSGSGCSRNCATSDIDRIKLSYVIFLGIIGFLMRESLRALQRSRSPGGARRKLHQHIGCTAFRSRCVSASRSSI